VESPSHSKEGEEDEWGLDEVGEEGLEGGGKQR